MRKQHDVSTSITMLIWSNSCPQIRTNFSSMQTEGDINKMSAA